MNLIDKFNAAVGKLVGPNAVHAVDAIVAFELTAAGTAVADPSARTYAASHPWLIVVFSILAPVLTAGAARFRKAATAPKAAPAQAAAAAPVAAVDPTPPAAA